MTQILQHQGEAQGRNKDLQWKNPRPKIINSNMSDSKYILK